MHILLRAAVSAAALFVADTAQAVTGGTGLPSATSWGMIPGENSTGASAVITTTAAQSGNGSVEFKGDRTWF